MKILADPVNNNPAGLVPPTPPLAVQSGYQPNTDELLKRGHAETAHKLAKYLLLILGGSVLVHYACIMVLIFYKRDDGIKILEEFFHTWLPVLSGLAGSAVTYYFTRDQK